MIESERHNDFACRPSLRQPTRIMANADIREALTAVDRPYAKGNMPPESLAMAARMQLDSHIDGGLFELFVGSGVYVENANGFVRPERIDEADTEALPRAASAEACKRFGSLGRSA